MSNFVIRKVAVLGAGVMGAQIAAHFVNCNIPAILFDLPAKDGKPNGIVDKALAGLIKIEPSPLAVKDRINYIDAANYEQHLPLLTSCDLVVEAIAEKMEWKQDLCKKISPYLGANAIFASNTSGLSINKLSENLPENSRHRFCGIHFFNPPRYMHLVEVIPCTASNPTMFDQLESFLTTSLGKGVIRTKDTPNFIANRIGVFSMLAVMHHTQQFKLGFDVVDSLTGPLIGRAKSATYRTADIVGLDTLGHVIKTMQDTLPNDPWHKYFNTPAWLAALVSKGALGQKAGAGVFRKLGKEIQVIDLAKQDYRPSMGAIDPEVEKILKIKDPKQKFSELRKHNHPQAQFVWAIFRDLFHYCAFHLADIADNARDLDLALRWGFGWALGPFEIWQASGWLEIAKAVSEDVQSNKAMATMPLPSWVMEIGENGVHFPQGAYSPVDNTVHPRSNLPVYQRQLFPDRVISETANYGRTIFENEAVRMWDSGDHIAVLSFKEKMHTISDHVLEGTIEAVTRAERDYKGLVIWQTEPPFSVGANLKKVLTAVGENDFARLEKMIAKFQQATQALKYSQVPTVVAVQGMALGGGCEYAMHSTRTVAALESYLGLVEAGVGVLPGGGGCKELALRAFKTAAGNDFFPFIKNFFQIVAMATVSKSALEAKELGLLRDSDIVVANAFELLYVAKGQVWGLYESGYRPPLSTRNIAVAGKTGIATLELMLVNMKEGGMISEHDFLIGLSIAKVLCGGEVESGSLVNEQWLLDLEREYFMQLLRTEKTQARIKYTMETGKPLRN